MLLKLNIFDCDYNTWDHQGIWMEQFLFFRVISDEAIVNYVQGIFVDSGFSRSLGCLINPFTASLHVIPCAKPIFLFLR